MIVVSGIGGEVLVGYQKAATLQRWTLRDGLLTGESAAVDDYWLSQPYAKTLRVPVGKSVWMWRDVDVTFTGATLLVRVSGSPEQR